MKNLKQELMELFQMSDGLLLPDEPTLAEISRKQQEIEAFGEKLVLQGFITMRNFLAELAGQNIASPIHFMDELNRALDERSPSNHLKPHSDSPSVWELNRHLSNWMTVFVSPIRSLDIRGDTELIKCLESTERHIPILAAIMLGNKEFNYLGDIEKFAEILSIERHTSLRLEICRLIYFRYSNPHLLRGEMVPNIISSNNEYDAIFENDDQRERLLSYVRELVIWDIATNGGGPKTKWVGWWVCPGTY